MDLDVSPFIKSRGGRFDYMLVASLNNILNLFRNALFAAMSTGQLEILKLFNESKYVIDSKKFQSVNIPEIIKDSKDKKLNTPLHKAVEHVRSSYYSAQSKLL